MARCCGHVLAFDHHSIVCAGLRRRRGGAGQLCPGDGNGAGHAQDEGLTRQFYQRRNGVLAWGGGATVEAKLAISVLQRLPAKGSIPIVIVCCSTVEKGIKTAKGDVEMAARRLKLAREMYENRPRGTYTSRDQSGADLYFRPDKRAIKRIKP